MTTSDKIKKLDKELSRLKVIAPFVSEGNISLVQIGRFSKKQKLQWEKDKSRRFDVMAELKILRLPTKEKKRIILRDEIKKLKTHINQNDSQIRTLKDFPQVKSPKMNKLKKRYLLYIEESKEFSKQITKLKNKLNKL